MKKVFLALCMMASSVVAMAQIDENDDQLFNHFGAGIEAGTDGIGFNVATTVTPYVQLRAGMSFLPAEVSGINVNLHMDANTRQRWDNFQAEAAKFQNAAKNSPEWKEWGQYHLPNGTLTEDVGIKGKLNKTDFKFLVDLYPTKTSAWRLTVGFYAGSSKFVEANTTNYQDHLNAVVKFNELTDIPNSGYAGKKIGAQIGDYLLTPYKEGEPARGYIKVGGFRPYIGIGSGRAISHKHRFSFAWDLGCQFWGSPKFYVEQKDGDVQVKKEDVDGEGGGILKTMSQITVYPSLNFRFNGRIL